MILDIFWLNLSFFKNEKVFEAKKKFQMTCLVQIPSTTGKTLTLHTANPGSISDTTYIALSSPEVIPEHRLLVNAELWLAVWSLYSCFNIFHHAVWLSDGAVYPSFILYSFILLNHFIVINIYCPYLLYFQSSLSTSCFPSESPTMEISYINYCNVFYGRAVKGGLGHN